MIIGLWVHRSPKTYSAWERRPCCEVFLFLKRGKYLSLVNIIPAIAENAGKLRGKYPALKAFDAIQISTAIYCSADVFITNDMNLKQVSDIDLLVLKDFI